MQLSDLKPGDRFRMAANPVMTFTLINPRIGIFSFTNSILENEPYKFAYVSDSNELYASAHDYEILQISHFDNSRQRLQIGGTSIEKEEQND